MADTVRNEFTELPDEFDGRGPAAEPEPERRRKGNWLLAAAAVLLLLPLTVLPGFYGGVRPEPIPSGPVQTGEPEPVPVAEPEPEPEPEPDEGGPDYEIVGAWQFEDEIYLFTVNGGGFYYRGAYYDYLTWEAEETDYRYTGGGMEEFGFSEDTYSEEVSVIAFSALTKPGDGGLWLESRQTGGQELFTPLASMDPPLDVITTVGQPLTERIRGYWARERSEDPSGSIYAYYLDLEDPENGMLHMHSYMDDDMFIPVRFTEDPDQPEHGLLTNPDGGDLYYEFRDEMDYLNTYTMSEIHVYYFADSEGEGLLVQDFSRGTVMRREADH